VFDMLGAQNMGALDFPTILTKHRLTVADYHRMAETGVLTETARTELIEGEIIDMAPIGTRHASAVTRVARRCERVVGDAAIVWQQNPLRLDEHSEPEPDLLLLKPRDDFYASAHPVPADVLLLIEVSDSTARYDREIKLPLYARHGVSEVWIIDLDAKLIRCFRKPHGNEYLEATASAEAGVMAVQAMPGVSIDLSGVLG
jgi:Uma2 family endonuclease